MCQSPFAYFEIADSFAVRYPTSVNFVGFRSQFEAFRVFYYTDELWDNKTVSVDDNVIYVIYVYI